MINPMELSGKHVLITGASSGIGRQTCILASQLGARISLVARNQERLEETLSQMEGEGHRAYSSDLTNLDGIESLVKDIVSNQGMLDGVVHCAGVGSSRPIHMIKPRFLDSVMRINFHAFVELVRITSKKKNTNNGASMIGVSSVAAFLGNEAQGAYAASKAAMNGFIHSAAKELSDRKIRVNTVAFGMIRTEMFEGFRAVGGDVSQILSHQYMGIGEPEDAAKPICFLLSNASGFITGTALVADGGYLS